MDAREQLSLYVKAYKQAGDPSGAGSGKTPNGKGDLTERALAILRKRGQSALRTVGKGLEKADQRVQAAGAEQKCKGCGRPMSECKCGGKC